jgi:hypothetical protein
MVSLRTASVLDTQEDTNTTQDDSSSGGTSEPQTKKPKLQRHLITPSFIYTLHLAEDIYCLEVVKANA